MTKRKTTILLVVLGVGTAATLFLHFDTQAKLRGNAATLFQRNQELTELLAENESLSNKVATLKNSTNDPASELPRLRQEAQALQRQIIELANQPSNSPSSPARSVAKPELRSPEYFEQLHRTAGAKTWDARNLSQVFAIYAGEHQGRFPSSLDQVAAYLDSEKMPLSGTNQFDIVFQGSLEELKGIPGGAVALIRDRQIWTAPSGKPARVYGLANGSSLIVESDDNFKAWEAEHVISTEPARK